MADLDFLAASTNPNAELVVILPDSTAERIRRLSTDEIRHRCPLLYFAFEDPLQSPRQASIEATSLQVVTCFLRYLYTGSYLKPDEEPQECSLRLHAELYKMADDFQVPELQVSAYVNFIESTEWSCSFPSPPLGLCDAIQFIYKHIAYDKSHQQQGLIESLLSYCVSSFRYHRLDENPDFRQVVFDNPAFHKQLCETSMARDFQDDGADDIIRLPVCRPQPQSLPHLNHCDVADFFCDPEEKIEHTTKKQCTVSREGTTMALRLRKSHKVTLSSGSESSSDDDGFALVHRPKPTLNPTTAANITMEDHPSSLGLASAPSSQSDFEILRFSENEHSPLLQHATSMMSNLSELTSETLLDLSSDEDWSMI